MLAASAPRSRWSNLTLARLAVREKGVSFNQLDDGTMGGIRDQNVSEDTGEEDPPDQIVKSYEISRDRAVSGSTADLYRRECLS